MGQCWPPKGYRGDRGVPVHVGPPLRATFLLSQKAAFLARLLGRPPCYKDLGIIDILDPLIKTDSISTLSNFCRANFSSFTVSVPFAGALTSHVISKMAPDRAFLLQHGAPALVRPCRNSSLVRGWNSHHSSFRALCSQTSALMILYGTDCEPIPLDI